MAAFRFSAALRLGRARFTSNLHWSHRAFCTVTQSNVKISTDPGTMPHPILHPRLQPIQAWVRDFQTGDKLGIVELDRDVFGARARLDILNRVVLWQRAKRRAGTAKVKNRGEVRGGGRKPWPQKRLGKARQGSIRAPQFRGGGVVHGPRGPVLL